MRLARAVAPNPTLVIAEHPSAALPRDAVARVAADVARVAAARGAALVTLTADPAWVEAVGGDVLTLQPGLGRTGAGRGIRGTIQADAGRALTMPYGNIVRLEAERGFGFIRDDGGMDWFFVAADVRGGRFEHIWVGERVASRRSRRRAARAPRTSTTSSSTSAGARAGARRGRRLSIDDGGLLN